MSTNVFLPEPKRGNRNIAHEAMQFKEALDTRLAARHLLDVAQGNPPASCKTIIDTDRQRVLESVAPEVKSASSAQAAQNFPKALGQIIWFFRLAVAGSGWGWVAVWAQGCPEFFQGPGKALPKTIPFAFLVII